MSTPKVSVTRPEHLVPGGVYRLFGSEEGKNIPPQAIRVESSVKYRGILDTGHVEVTWFTDLGVQGKHKHRGLLFLSEVNIPEHGHHDRHLERVSSEELARAAQEMMGENRKQEYTEMATDDEDYQNMLNGRTNNGGN